MPYIIQALDHEYKGRYMPVLSRWKTMGTAPDIIKARRMEAEIKPSCQSTRIQWQF